MTETITRRGVRRRNVPADVPGDSVRAPTLQETVDSLQLKLQRAAAINAALATRVETLRAIIHQRENTAHSPPAFVERQQTLTEREREVLTRFLEHFNDKQVAKTLGTRQQTVRNQIRSIQIKLGEKSRAEMVAAALGGSPASLYQ